MQTETGPQAERAVVSLAAPDNQRASASGLAVLLHPLLNVKNATPISFCSQDGQWLNKQAKSNWITARTLEIIQDERCPLLRIKRCANVLPILAFIYPCNDGHCINNLCKKNA